MVHFVGAGPGACDLITVRGMNRIKEADVIIYAGSLVNPGLLSYAKADCKIYNSAHMTLDAVVDVMREVEAAGKGTVRRIREIRRCMGQSASRWICWMNMELHMMCARG